MGKGKSRGYWLLGRWVGFACALQKNTGVFGRTREFMGLEYLLVKTLDKELVRETTWLSIPSFIMETDLGHSQRDLAIAGGIVLTSRPPSPCYTRTLEPGFFKTSSHHFRLFSLRSSSLFFRLLACPPLSLLQTILPLATSRQIELAKPDEGETERQSQTRVVIEEEDPWRCRYAERKKKWVRDEIAYIKE